MDTHSFVPSFRLPTSSTFRLSGWLPPGAVHKGVVIGGLVLGGGYLLLSAPDASADVTVPDPAHCSVTPCDGLGGVVLVPDLLTIAPAADIHVNVRNESNAPIMGWRVDCVFAAGTPCPSAVLSGVTDSNGDVSFRFTGGGCIDQTSVVRIDVSSTEHVYPIRSFDVVKSPDFDGASGDGIVNVADLVTFSSEFLGTSPAGCHDYDNTGETDLGDLVIFSPAFAAAAHCR